MSWSVQFESPSHSQLVLTGLNSLRSKKQLMDVTLIADGQRFDVHRVVLASCSDYFRAMFTDAMKECNQTEIVLNGVTSEGMLYMVNHRFNYTLYYTCI